MIQFEELPEFGRDLKSLLKKFKTLTDDMVDLKKALAVSPDQRPPTSFRISDLGITTCVIKVKKIACRSLKGRGVNSGLRLVYAWFAVEERIVFIEIYHKADQPTESRDRILAHFS